MNHDKRAVLLSNSFAKKEEEEKKKKKKKEAISDSVDKLNVWEKI